VRAPRRYRRRQEQARTGWSAPRWHRVLALIVVLVAFLAPRVNGLDRLVTPDEPLWLARSANFYEALASGDLGSTYQFAHPGVPVMWLGAAGYFWAARDYPDRVEGQIDQRQNIIAGVLQEQDRDPLDVMVAGRRALILGMAIVVAMSFLVTLRLFGFWETTLGFLLLLLDPFPVGITRLLHVDGITSIFMLLSVVAGLAYLLRGRKRSDLVISGIAAGLAVLTRTQMGVLGLWFGVILVIDALGWRARWPGFRSTLESVWRPALAWGGVVLATIVALWPALWVDPIRVAKGILDFVGTAALEGHERAVFFAGTVYEGDPGWRFYPTTFAWRATVPVLIGVAAALALVVFSRRWRVPSREVRVVVGMLVAVSAYALMMSVAAKKFDRYLLPAYPLLALVAGWGLVLVARRVGRRVPGPEWGAVVIVGLLALALQIGATVRSAPYFLSYYNPLLGGTEKAASTMMVGWGEGFDQVAEYVNTLPERENLRVSTEAWRTPLSYYLDAEAQFAAFVPDRSGVFRWATTDLYVLYLTPLTRNGVWPEFLDYLDDLEPARTVSIGGLDYARVYDLRDEPVPPYLEDAGAGMVDWLGIGRMVTAGRIGTIGAEQGRTVVQIVYFDRLATDDLAAIAERYEARLILRDPGGETVSVTSYPLVLEAPERHGLFAFEAALDIPNDLPRGAYRIALQIVERESGAVVPAFSYRYGDRMGESMDIDAVFVVGSLEELEALGEDPLATEP
jgi:hypothetical protein